MIFFLFLKTSILATSLDHNACFNTFYPVQCLQSVTVVVSGCGSCDPKMWMLCSKDVKVVGKRCAFCCRNCCRQKIKTFSVIRIWASYLDSLKVAYIKFSFSTKDSLLDFLNVTLIFLSMKMFLFSAGSHSGTKKHIFFPQLSHP